MMQLSLIQLQIHLSISPHLHASLTQSFPCPLIRITVGDLRISTFRIWVFGVVTFKPIPIPNPNPTPTFRTRACTKKRNRQTSNLQDSARCCSLETPVSHCPCHLSAGLKYPVETFTYHLCLWNSKLNPYRMRTSQSDPYHLPFPRLHSASLFSFTQQCAICMFGIPLCFDLPV